MPLPTESEPSVIAPRLDTRAQWEERASHRVLGTRRDQILERSRHIVEAGHELLGEAGLDGLTIRAVLRKTGLSRRAFYERFADKDDLVLAVFEHAIRLASGHYRRLLSTLTDPIERLKLIVSTFVVGVSALEATDSGQSTRRSTAMSREHLRLAQSRPRDLQAALNPLITLIAEQLSDGMDAGLVRRCDSQRLAALVYNLVATTVHTEFLIQETAQPDQVHRAELANDIWEFCRRAITV